MNRQWLNKAIRTYIRIRFRSAPAALGAALSEVQLCAGSAEYLAAVRRMVGLLVPAAVAVLLIALRRGALWE